MRRGKMNLGLLVIVVLMTCFGFSAAQAQSSYPDLSIWLDQWFKISVSFQRLHFSDKGVAPYPGMDAERGTGYLTCTALTPTPYDPNVSPVLSCDVYAQDETGVWQAYPFDFHYVAGNVSNFASWAEYSNADMVNAFTIQVKGTQKTNKSFSGATVKTLGGYSWEIDNVVGSTERWVGSIQFSGSWIDPATLCKSPKNSTLPPCK